MPLAAFATWSGVGAGDVLTIRAAWGDAEGVLPLIHAQASAVIADAQAATRLGEQVARSLQAQVQAQAQSSTQQPS